MSVVYYFCMAIALITPILYALLKHLILRIPKSIGISGKHVLITGGSKGIGKALAIKCAKQGANVTIIARNEETLKCCLIELTKICDLNAVKNGKGQWAKYLSMDLMSDGKEIETQISEYIEKTGPVDILINNAGSSSQSSLLALSVDDFENQMKSNYLSAVHVTRAVIPSMTQKTEFNAEGESTARGRIVFLSSQAGQIGLFGYCAYSPSKFAIRGFAEALQMELTPFDISVTVVYPPNTNTEGLKKEIEEMPEETKKISETAGLFDPDYVAEIIMEDTQNGLHCSSIGLDGWMLAIITAGAAPETNIKNVFQQCFFAPLFRFVILCYQANFRRIVRNCHWDRKKNN